MVFAVSHSVFDSFARGSNPNANPLCGRRIRASRFDEQANAQRSVDLTLVDRCEFLKEYYRQIIMLIMRDRRWLQPD